MRAASFRPSAPRQPWTLYEATRRQSGPSCCDSAVQLARLLSGRFLSRMDAGGHFSETEVHRPDARGEEAEHDAHHPPVDGATRERGLDLVAEDGGREGARKQADRGADRH